MMSQKEHRISASILRVLSAPSVVKKPYKLQ